VMEKLEEGGRGEERRAVGEREGGEGGGGAGEKEKGEWDSWGGCGGWME